MLKRCMTFPRPPPLRFTPLNCPRVSSAAMMIIHSVYFFVTRKCSSIDCYFDFRQPLLFTGFRFLYLRFDLTAPVFGPNLPFDLDTVVLEIALKLKFQQRKNCVPNYNLTRTLHYNLSHFSCIKRQSKMYYKCSISNCSSHRNDVRLHIFPSNERNRNKWLKYINCKKILNMDLKDLSKLYVCHKHFERRFITAKSRLFGNAYPSLFTPDEIANGLPAVAHEDSECTVLEMDHNYSRKSHYDHSYSKCELLTQHSSTTMDEPEVHCSSTAIVEPELHRSTTPTVETESQYVNILAPPKSSRKRLVQSIQSLTPKCRKLYTMYSKIKDFKTRAKRALKFSKEKSFEKLSSKLNPYSRQILAMQLNLCCKKAKGRRFSMEEKIISLSILKQSPKCYRFLQKIFILPSKSVLNKMISKLDLEAGINQHLFQLMKKKVEMWDDNKKYCSIIFDEMALEPGLTYNNKKDKINGFVELQERRCQFADHCLVFMLRGAVYKYQQPLGYYFCEGATSGPQLKNILKDVVTAVVDIHLKPLALICDQGSAFQSALKSLQEDTRRNCLSTQASDDGVIEINGVKLNIIYDPSHLIKGLRNNFLTKDIKFEGKIAKWQDIVDVYKTDCHHAEVRLLHKLNDEHVLPEKIKKMKVKNCVRVFSKTVAAALSYTARFSQYVDGNPVSSTLKNTSEMVSFFDDLFDSVNGASVFCKKRKAKQLRTAVVDSSKHHEFWKYAIQKLNKIKFFDPKKNRETTVPTLKNWVITLKSLMRVWQFFKSKNIKIMRPRYFNSDPIENYFGQVRAYNYRNNNPTCHTFACTFKSLLITGIIKFHSQTFNCEDDAANHIINLQDLFLDNIEKTVNIQPPHPHTVALTDNIQEEARRERLNIHSRAYATGWVVRKILNKIKCTTCKSNLTSSIDESQHIWISAREYKTAVKKKLSYPSEHALRAISSIIKESNEYLEEKGHGTEILKEIKENLYSKYSFDFLTCEIHKSMILEYLLNISVKFTIFNWCNVLNKILKGTDISRLENRPLPFMQTIALNKFKKKLKNKMK